MAARTVTLTTSPTLIARAKPSALRQWVTVEMDADAPRDAYIGIGDAAVTTTTGHALAAGKGIFIGNDPLSKPAAKAIYGIVASGTVDVLVDEGT